MSLLEIEDLSLAIGRSPILNGVGVVLEAGETLGLVGESGSGKSLTALSVMRLLPPGSAVTGAIRFAGADLLASSERKMCAIRGRDIGMVFQEPMTALNPLKTVGEQVAEGIRLHTGANRADAEARAAHMLDRVGLPPAKFPLSRFPHQLSGGQRQRVVIAIACALKPKLLIADEPTTALDVVIQAQILVLLRELVAADRMALLLISHDLAVVTDMADRVAIMNDGRIVETGPTAQTLSKPGHPYTLQLAEASVHVPARKYRSADNNVPLSVRFADTSPPVPEGEGASQAKRTSSPLTKWGRGVREADGEGVASTRVGPELRGHALLAVEKVSREHPGPRKSLFSREPPFRAVDDVSFAIAPGESVALVGRSGCGKSTLARLILALDRPTAGTIRFRGEPLAAKTDAEMRPIRRDMQVVFQDPYGSFDPRMSVERLVTEPLHLLDEKPSRTERRDRAAAALEEVGLPVDALSRYPHEFSGGQRQRLSIARAIITRPKLVVADEPVSALDVSIRAQILDLFADLNARLGLAYLFITHDLTVARAITDRVLVMHEGRIVEEGATAEVLDHPASLPAQDLVAAAPDLRRSLARRLAATVKS